MKIESKPQADMRWISARPRYRKTIRKSTGYKRLVLCVYVVGLQRLVCLQHPRCFYTSWRNKVRKDNSLNQLYASVLISIVCAT